MFLLGGAEAELVLERVERGKHKATPCHDLNLRYLNGYSSTPLPPYLDALPVVAFLLGGAEAELGLERVERGKHKDTAWYDLNLRYVNAWLQPKVYPCLPTLMLCQRLCFCLVEQKQSLVLNQHRM